MFFFKSLILFGAFSRPQKADLVDGRVGVLDRAAGFTMAPPGVRVRGLQRRVLIVKNIVLLMYDILH